jgi:hypothetical protein
MITPLGARHSDGAIFRLIDKDARSWAEVTPSQSRAPSNERSEP